MTIYDTPQSVDDESGVARRKAKDNHQMFYDSFRHDIRRWKLGKDEEEFLRQITTQPIAGRALLSNARVRRALQAAAIKALTEAFNDHPERQWLWITIATDIGVTWENAPEIDLASLRGIAYRHLQRSGLDGFGIVETDTWKLIAGEESRRMVPHFHFIGFPADGRLAKITELAAKLCERSALTNSLGAKGVKIRNVGKSAGDHAHLGYYMTKLPTHAKNPVPRADGQGYVLKDVEHAAGSVARLTEVLSHCEAQDALFSIGRGREIAEKVRSAIRCHVRDQSRASPAPSRDRVEAMWASIRECNGSQKFEPCRITTRRPPDDGKVWIELI